MLKVYEVNRYYQLNNQGAWFRLGDSFRILEDRDNLPAEEIIIDNLRWGEVMEYLDNNRIIGLRKDETLFKKKPYLYYYDQCEKKKKFYNNDFETLSYKVVYKEIENVTLDYISKHFPASKVIQYFNEHGITTCPFLPQD